VKRYEISSHLIRTRGLDSYLEIGTSTGKCIARVKCKRREGVDPNPRGEGKGWTLHRMTSDEFFAKNRDRFGVIFVDGLHHSDQALRDILNAVRCLEPGGVVLVHDCNPLTEEAQRREQCGGTWNGDVWKAIAYIRKRVPGLSCRVIAADQGVGVIVPRGSDIPCYADVEADAARFMESLTWEDLEGNREDMLGLVDGRDAGEELLRG
jgi:hypothetical protein